MDLRSMRETTTFLCVEAGARSFKVTVSYAIRGSLGANTTFWAVWISAYCVTNKKWKRPRTECSLNSSAPKPRATALQCSTYDVTVKKSKWARTHSSYKFRQKTRIWRNHHKSKSDLRFVKTYVMLSAKYLSTYCFHWG